MKFVGTAAELAASFGQLVGADSSELRGLKYLAARLLGEDPDSSFDIVFEDGEWRLTFSRDLTTIDKRAAAAVRRYAGERFAALEGEINRMASGPVSLSLAAYLLGTVPDAVRAQIQKGRLEGRSTNGRFTTTLDALVRLLEQYGAPSRTYELR